MCRSSEDIIPTAYECCSSTSLHNLLSLQSYSAVLDVNRKEPSPLQFEAAALHIFGDDDISHIKETQVNVQKHINGKFFCSLLENNAKNQPMTEYNW
jgi:hypothetical protein